MGKEIDQPRKAGAQKEEELKEKKKKKEIKTALELVAS